MALNIQETYGAIPCTITYDVLDASLNSIFSRTVSNPPSQIPLPTCKMGTPAFIQVTACGTTFRMALSPGACQDILLFCNCLPNPGWYAFSFCLVSTPSGTCDYQLNIQV